MTLAEAKRLAILKWESIVSNNGSDWRIHFDVPELKTIMNSCGFCERAQQVYHNKISANRNMEAPRFGRCTYCPLPKYMGDFSSTSIIRWNKIKISYDLYEMSWEEKRLEDIGH